MHKNAFVSLGAHVWSPDQMRPSARHVACQRILIVCCRVVRPKAREACGVVVDMIRAKKMAGRALLLTGLYRMHCRM